MSLTAEKVRFGDLSAVEVTYLYGEKNLVPIKVWVETRYHKRRWWFGEKTVYYVCTEFMSQGPFSSEHDAWETADLLRSLMKS